MADQTTPGKLYGRRKGRPLRVRKSALMQDLLPRLQISLPATIPLSLASLFNAASATAWLEVGFGGGEHLAAQAAQRPDIQFIGCEPFVNGVASLLDHIDQQQLSNIRIFADDARLLLDALPDACLQRCFVLYADPWPKARHAERRFISPENLDRLARVMAARAELRLATDVAGLAEWMQQQASAHQAFKQTYHSQQPPADWVPTRYEQKGIKAGRNPTYMSFRRL